MCHGPQPHPHATLGRGRGGDYGWFDPETAIGNAWGRHLPHWRQRGAIYFVTFRTADSIPADVLATWRRERDAWLAAHPAPHDEATARDFHTRFTARLHRFLDEGHGACPFRDPVARSLVTGAMTCHDGIDHALDAYVVMPNHVHALVAPRGAAELSEITKVWKRVSAHRVNRLLGQRGGFWQQESWDHIVRGPEHLERYRRYIEANPQRLPRV